MVNKKKFTVWNCTFISYFRDAKTLQVTYRIAFYKVDLKFIRCTFMKVTSAKPASHVEWFLSRTFLRKKFERERVCHESIRVELKLINTVHEEPVCNQRTGSRWSVGGEAAELRACLITALMGNKDELRRVTGGRISLQGHNIKHTICPSEETAFLMLLIHTLF